MREIKFRAWDKLNKQMLELNQLCFEDDSEPYMRKGIIGKKGHNHFQHYNFEDSILMQYTGLKDKNGKEIWEGDVVKICRVDGTKCEFAQVIYNEKMTGFGAIRNPLEIAAMLSIGEHVEIIGNIYENPELTPLQD